MITTLTLDELKNTVDENNQPNLIKLYDVGAKKLNINVGEDEKYDCTKINISRNIYDFYHNIANEDNGKDGVMELNMLFLLMGPKVEEYLNGLQIEFQENAIRKED